MAEDKEKEQLPPDSSPDRGLEANLSEEEPEGRDQRYPQPETYPVTEDGED